MYFTSSCLRNHTFILYMKLLGPREVRWLTQGHTASKTQSWEPLKHPQVQSIDCDWVKGIPCYSTGQQLQRALSFQVTSVVKRAPGYPFFLWDL